MLPLSFPKPMRPIPRPTEEKTGSHGHYQHKNSRSRQLRAGAGSETETTANNNETSHGEEDDSDDDDAEMKTAAGPEDYYCKNMDDDDEAWVYKNIRGGREESVQVQRQQQKQSSMPQKVRVNKLMRMKSQTRCKTSEEINRRSDGRRCHQPKTDE